MNPLEKQTLSISPHISVLMSVYHEPIDWLALSVDSILNQSFSDFEFIIIVDDPNNQEAINYIRQKEEEDNRIVLLINEENVGLTKSLNKGLKIAKGNYIARMDADDISYPERFEKQFTFMESHPSVILLGTGVRYFGDLRERETRQIIYQSDNDKIKIKAVFDSIPSQLDDKNRRFIISKIEKDARIRRYENCFEWLADAGVALPCYNLTEPKIPLKINEQSRLFKLYMSDVGLLCAMSLENIQFEILQGNLSINMGGILENAFAELLKANGFALRYLNKKNIGELDFVVQQNDEVMPIEIKSGKDYKTHAALNNALKVKEWNLKKGIVFCMDNIQKTEKITYLPWYLVMFLKQNNHDESMIVNVDLSGL